MIRPCKMQPWNGSLGGYPYQKTSVAGGCLSRRRGTSLEELKASPSPAVLASGPPGCQKGRSSCSKEVPPGQGFRTVLPAKKGRLPPAPKRKRKRWKRKGARGGRKPTDRIFGQQPRALHGLLERRPSGTFTKTHGEHNPNDFKHGKLNRA